MMDTTYKHDYVSPYTKRYQFKHLKSPDEEKVECQCVDENEVDIPKVIQTECNAEWTGIAPMGRLINRRVIPTKFLSNQLDVKLNDNHTDCFKEQPNRFLRILRTTYPDLYERLKQMPKDELNRRLERDRMYTTYQVDFCNIDEYPGGIYKSLSFEDETSKLNTSKLLKWKEPCAELRANVMEELFEESTGTLVNSHGTCEKAYKPFKISFADSSRFINSGNNSHWRSNVFTKKVKFSEYMDTINKVGCVIMKNNIHNHQKCTEKNCRHQLTHTCTKLK